jgi:hypothetical protein
MNGDPLMPILPEPRPDGAPAGSYRPPTVDELRALAFAEPDFLVEGVLARGDLAVLGGETWGGRSWLLLQLAQAVDTGQPFLNRPARRGRVLFVALRDGPARIQQRILALGWRPRRTALLTRLPPLDGDDGPGPGLTRLRELAAGCELIILDDLMAGLTLPAMQDGKGEVGRTMDLLGRIAREQDVAIVVTYRTDGTAVPHPFDLLRGTSGRPGCYDVGLALQHKGLKAVLRVQSSRGDWAAITIGPRPGPTGRSGWRHLGG